MYVTFRQPAGRVMYVTFRHPAGRVNLSEFVRKMVVNLFTLRPALCPTVAKKECIVRQLCALIQMPRECALSKNIIFAR